MKKLLVVLFSILLLVGCSKPASSNESGSGSGSAGEGETGSNLNPTTNSIYDFKVIIEEVEYTLPIAVSEMAANGWVLEANVMEQYQDQMLAKNKIINNVFLVKGDWKIEVVLENTSIEEVSLDQMTVVEMTFNPTVNTYPAVTFAEGITLANTLEDVLNAYGQFTGASEEAHYYSINYVEDGDFLNGGRYQFHFLSSEPTEQIQRVIIRNK